MDKGHAKCVQVLLDSGAGVDTVDESGITPLISATSAGHSTILKLLLRVSHRQVFKYVVN